MLTGCVSPQTIENLPISPNLRSLFLGKNKITKIEVSDSDFCPAKMLRSYAQGLDGLVNLKRLSIQSTHFLLIDQIPVAHLIPLGNRVTKIEGLDSLVNLEELYLLHNGLTKVEGLTHNVGLPTQSEMCGSCPHPHPLAPRST